MTIKRAGIRTEKEKRQRCLEVMRMHSAGYAALTIAKRTGTEVSRAYRWAQELNIEWTGKPVRQLKNQITEAEPT